MKTKEPVIKDFRAVDFVREVRSKISKDIENMNEEQIKRYFEKRKHRGHEKNDESG